MLPLLVFTLFSPAWAAPKSTPNKLTTTSGASHAYQVNSAPPGAKTNTNMPINIESSACGQRCAFLTSAEIYSYYSLYASSNLAATNSDVEKAKTKNAINSCLKGSGKNCSAQDRELLVSRVTQYNYYRDIRRKMLEAQTAAKALQSNKPFATFNGKNTTLRTADERDINLLRNVMKQKDHTPGELKLDKREVFKIDPNTLDQNIDENVAFQGGFKQDYQYVLNNYVRPRIGPAEGLMNKYTDPNAANYANYTAKDSESVLSTVQPSGANESLVTTDSARHQQESQMQNSAVMNQARKEFETKYKDRDLKAQRTKDGVKLLNYGDTGAPTLGLSPKNTAQSVAPLKSYQDTVKDLNKTVDASIAAKKKQDKTATVAAYSLDVGEFDKFLDQIWPTKP